MLRQTVPIIDEINQSYSLKVIVLKSRSLLERSNEQLLSKNALYLTF